MSFVPLDQLRTASHHSSAISSQPSSDYRLRLPSWFKVTARTGPDYLDIKQTMERLKLHTICEEARCPNRWECWNARTATFLILGHICTRRCHYCSVETGRPHSVDLDEPGRVAEAVKALDLRHAVITSVNRDELDDGGASVFAETIRQTRRLNPTCTIEVLIPDFEGNEKALAAVCAEKPEILNHNIETVRRLFPSIRPQGKYQRSIDLLAKAKQLGVKTKSGLILGMGETLDEAREVMCNLRAVDCDIMTIGQYLQPTREHLPVAKFYDPPEFALLKEEGLAMGFSHIESGPLVRSSYHAEQQVAGA
ncbi:Lipoyl synthase [Candidatus Nitrospira nitrosa]|uniref:Lipoyl synthase n=1 Tax=Candidatus Nitrospira nitrosa TaxID=1742972 RepID=A0A0S4LP17_9BACT|nr:lipoyl synthase [Candidatus Nitrospira nitrosa]CUS38991.1 Lipoyl synthase [Candidatus Nitrospira nitrosa]